MASAPWTLRRRHAGTKLVTGRRGGRTRAPRPPQMFARNAVARAATAGAKRGDSLPVGGGGWGVVPGTVLPLGTISTPFPQGGDGKSEARAPVGAVPGACTLVPRVAVMDRVPNGKRRYSPLGRR